MSEGNWETEKSNLRPQLHTREWEKMAFNAMACSDSRGGTLLLLCGIFVCMLPLDKAKMGLHGCSLLRFFVANLFRV